MLKLFKRNANADPANAEPSAPPVAEPDEALATNPAPTSRSGAERDGDAPLGQIGELAAGGVAMNGSGGSAGNAMGATRSADPIGLGTGKAEQGHAIAKVSRAAPTTSVGIFAGRTSADFEPLRGVIGLEQAREALSLVGRLEPRSAVYVMAPRTSAHTEAVRTILAGLSGASETREAIVLVSAFRSGGGGLDVLRMPAAEADALSSGVASAIEMLSATIPAAFESDSYRVARITLDEELRSGHDAALDALRRKAIAQNIGLLRTTSGYAVVPMHDGRVVRGEIYGALPGSLKTDVEAKLAAFEAELADVLKNRAVLQQQHYARAKALERDAAGLAVEAATAGLKQLFAARDSVVAWLARLSEDLVVNAQLFVAAARQASGMPRAPAEIDADPRLQRYRVALLSRGARGASGLEQPQALDRAELTGFVRGGGELTPAAVEPGAMTRPGGGIVVVDVRDLMADYAAWPLMKHALKSGQAAPLAAGDGVSRPAPIDLPVEVRLVVLGEADEYSSWCRLDADVARMVRTIDAFPRHLPASEASERLVARHLSGFVRDDGILPFDGPAIAAVYATLRADLAEFAEIKTDLGLARDLMAMASSEAAHAGRVMVLADDVARAIASRSRFEGAPVATRSILTDGSLAREPGA